MSGRLPANVRVLKGAPHTFGWLRRPELDRFNGGYHVWEMPDGELYLHPKDAPQLIIEKVIEKD